MGKTTKIKFCDSTVNPIMGCSGCELYSRDPALNHCYAARLCRRYAGRKGWPADFEQPEYFPGRIEQALRWSDLTGTDRPDKAWLSGMPRLVFVNDLGDGFCHNIEPEQWLPYPEFEAMAASPHIWLWLTKWPDRMSAFFFRNGLDVPDNFWLGTTVTQSSNLYRADALAGIPAKTKWLSLEPLLEPVNPIDYAFPNWIVVGAESGPSRRQMPPVWAQSLLRQCRGANVPFFVKQLSIAHSPERSSRNGKVSHDPTEWPEDLRVREMPHVG